MSSFNLAVSILFLIIYPSKNNVSSPISYNKDYSLNYFLIPKSLSLIIFNISKLSILNYLFIILLLI